jgi:hypothetical protein
MTLQKYMPITAAFAAILLVALFAFLVKLYRARVRIARLSNQGLVRHSDEVLLMSWLDC